MKPRKLLQKALASPANLRFEEVCALARAFGFRLSRVSEATASMFMQTSGRW